MDLLELAERCERARGPDRNLDRMIHCRDGLWGVGSYDQSPAYTASLDAAMSLLTNAGVLISLSEIKGDGMPICIVGNPATAELFEAVADTMPLALCAAALRAIARAQAPAPETGENPA